MNRGAFERRLSRLVEEMRDLRFNRQVLLMSFATGEESERLLQLIAKLEGPLRVTPMPEVITEISALFAAWDKRLKTRLGLE